MEIQKQGDTHYQEQLRELLSSVQDWDNCANRIEFQEAVEAFMERLWELYLDYFQYHPEDAQFCSVDYQELLRTQIPIINKYFAKRRMLIIGKADEYQDRWEIACLSRSKIEAFHQLFGSFAGKLDDEALVEYIGEPREFDGGTLKNKKIPKSHWWWFV